MRSFSNPPFATFSTSPDVEGAEVPEPPCILRDRVGKQVGETPRVGFSKLCPANTGRSVAPSKDQMARLALAPHPSSTELTVGPEAGGFAPLSPEHTEIAQEVIPADIRVELAPCWLAPEPASLRVLDQEDGPPLSCGLDNLQNELQHPIAFFNSSGQGANPVGLAASLWSSREV